MTQMEPESRHKQERRDGGSECSLFPLTLKILVMGNQVNLFTTRPQQAYNRQGLGWDPWARIQLARVHFGVFSMSRFTPLALSGDWILLIECVYSLRWDGWELLVESPTLQ